MSISPDEVKFCLRCATPLEWRQHLGDLRPVCPQCNYTHFFDPKVAVAVFIEQQGRVLMVQRAIEPQKGLWTVPGGYMDANEDPAEAAQRECLEETGLQVRITALLDLIAGREHQSGATFVLFYRAEVTGGKLRAADDADQVGWFGPRELPEIAFRATAIILERWQAGTL